MKCSIYIPVFNERDGLQRTLRALIPEKGTHEVYVVDAGSQDGSLDVAKSFDWVTVLESGEGMLANRLNQAADEGDGEVLLFLQAGAVPVRGWSEALANHFAAGADAGHFTLVEAEPSSKMAAGLRKLALKAGRQLIGGPVGLTGLAVRRATFGDVHGFAPVPDFEWLAFANRVTEAGGKVLPIAHEVQMAPSPGSRQADAWADLWDDLQAAWRYRKTDSFDLVRCRRKTSAAILMGHDLFESASVSDYFGYARSALLQFNVELLQSYRGARKVVFMGGKDTTKAVGQPSGVLVCPHIRTEIGKRFGNILTELADEGMDGILLVRDTVKGLTHARLRKLVETAGDVPCVILPNANGDEWLAMWINTSALDFFREWTPDVSIAALEATFFDLAMPLEVKEPVAVLKTDHDARAMYYAGMVDRLPAR